MIAVASTCLNCIPSTRKSVKCEEICIECHVKRVKASHAKFFFINAGHAKFFFYQRRSCKVGKLPLDFFLEWKYKSYIWSTATSFILLSSFSGWVLGQVGIVLRRDVWLQQWIANGNNPKNKLIKIKLLRNSYNGARKASGKLGPHEDSFNGTK